MAAWQRVLVSSATHEEHGACAGMTLLQRQLSKTGVITRPFVEGHHRVMAGVTEQNRLQGPFGTYHRQHWDGMFHRPFQLRLRNQCRHLALGIIAPVYCEPS